MKALREEEERRAELEEDEVLYTYSRDDALNQVKKKSKANRPSAPSRQSNRKSAAGVAPTPLPDNNNEVKVAVDSAKNSRLSSRRSSIASSCSTTSLSENSWTSSQPSSPDDSARTGRVGRPRKDTKTKRRYEDDDDYDIGHKAIRLTHVEKPNTRKHHVDDEVVGQGKKTVKSQDKATPKTQVAQKKVSPKKTKTTPKSNHTVAKPATPKAAVTSPKHSTPVPQPWSNPNLVIRTRRASNHAPVTDESSGSETTPTRPVAAKKQVNKVEIVPRNTAAKASVTSPARTVTAPVLSLSGAEIIVPASPVHSSAPQTVYVTRSPVMTRPAVTRVVMSSQGLRPAGSPQSIVRNIAPRAINPVAAGAQPSVSSQKANSITPILARAAEFLSPVASSSAASNSTPTSVATFRLGSPLGGSVSIVGNKAVLNPSVPVISSAGATLKPTILSGNTRFILNASSILTRPVTVSGTTTQASLTSPVAAQVVSNTTKVNNTVPILEKMAMQLSVPTTRATSLVSPSKGTPLRPMTPGKQTVAQLIAAKSATSPGHVVTRPAQVVARPGQIIRPGQVVTRPTQVVTRPAQVVTRPAQVVTRPGQVVTRPAQVVTRPGQVVTRPGQVVARPGQVVTRPGQVITRPGQVISRPLIAQIVPGKQGMAQIVATKQQVGGVTQLVAKQPVTAQVLNSPKTVTQVVGGRASLAQLPVIQGQQVTQVVRTSQGITQIVQGGKQVVRTAAPGQVHQVIQQGRPQFVVVSSGDTGQRSRYVLIQQPAASGQAKTATIKTIQGQTVVAASPQAHLVAKQASQTKGASS